ncbi:guided entry of tail-anchored proteins factor 1 isoform X2 [Nomia melanderi]|uniref:guided entry of tail-anchored proteins factor 1 isoform X2 n=1 Tax=Nomia melanderi TaxID=2448451 RepID=UPI0013044D6F|nr:tail-anchored protein insertion receptor WRB-like isoform X2 [Nomia melanderi]
MNLLVISTVSCVLEYIFPILVKYITTRLYTETKHDLEARKELVNLKQEMIELSIVDEFSKYAKLQRKYNKIEGSLKETVNMRLSYRIRMQLFATYGFRVLNGFLVLGLLYFYKNTPVIVFPKGILWPVQNLLSWPCYSQEDSISLIMWIIIGRLVVSACKNNIHW